MKKKLLLVLSVVATTTLSYSQLDFKFGVKAGINVPYSGKITEIPSFVDNQISNKGSGVTGFHAGFFSRFNVLGFFVQPEIYYMSYKNEYNNSIYSKYNVKTDRIDVPILAGVSILKVARLMAGPVFSTTVNEKFSIDSVKELDKNNFGVGGQLGLGATFQKFNVDLRYELPFGSTASKYINDLGSNQSISFKTDRRPSMLMLSLGYTF